MCTRNGISSLLPHLPSIQATMDLPDDKKQAVLGSSDEKKRLLLRDHHKQLQEVPIKFYLSKFAYVTEADTMKVRKRVGGRE